MRYSFNNGAKIKEILYYDVVIAGSGLAGLYTALNIDENFSCCVLTKESVDISSSWLAQGGIAAAISTDDNPLLHFYDTMEAGAGLCDEAAVHVLVEEGPSDIRALVDMNVPFDLNADGDLEITKEGGHRKRRIVHAGGDATGRETVKALAYITAQRSNVFFKGRTFLLDIITDERNEVSGALIRDDDGDYKLIMTKNIVICTGGVGQVYGNSTNPSIATGDGIAAAVRAGALLKNMEFIQFHPTGLYSPEKTGRAFLISEAVRGEGGLLVNSEGFRFMEGVHELNELAPRDVVARAIVRELERSGEPCVYVDITSKSEEYLSRRFPTIYNECLKHGINISRDKIPVSPVQHYLIGGIETNLNAQTNIEGLYACGEAAYTGVHGANRLASNSMLECLVFGRRAALQINRSLMETALEPSVTLPEAVLRPAIVLDYNDLMERIQGLMEDCGGVIRTVPGLEFALNEVEKILDVLESGFDDCRDYTEALNIATVAKTILTSALSRSESVGAHYLEK